MRRAPERVKRQSAKATPKFSLQICDHSPLAVCGPQLEGVYMQKRELIEYLADMATQLAALAREQLPAVATILEIAAELARDALGATR